MSDSTTFSDADFSPVDGSTASATPTSNVPTNYGSVQATPDQMDAWNQQATLMANIGGPGANQDAAQQWLQQQYSGASTTTSYNDSDFSPLPIPVKTVGNQGTPDTTLQSVGSAIVGSAKDYYDKSVSDVADTMQGVHDYFANYHANHQTVPGRPITPVELAAMKARGIDPGQAALDGTLIINLDSPTGYSYPVTYKVKEGEDLTGAGDHDLHPSVAGYLLNKSFLSKQIQDLASPHLSATKLQQTVQDTMRQQDIASHPDKYTPAQVSQAKQLLSDYKQQSTMDTMAKVKEGINSILANPADAITSFTDPAFLAAPEFKLGTLTYGTNLAKATVAAKDAAEIAASAQKIKEFVLANNVANKAAVIAKADKYIKVYGDVAEKAAANASRLSKLQKGGNVVGASVAGAGINSVISQQQQVQEQGFSNVKDTQAAGITGAVLGGALGGLGALGKEGEIPKTHPDNPNGTTPPEGPVTAREPGQPLPSTTPVDATKVVPYYGGVDAEGNVIHISKDTPTHIDIKDKAGNTTSVPVRQTVAYHESVEHPLMHLTGPVNDAQMQLIKERMGPYASMPKEVEAKLREGKGLSYGEAHDIATRSENHLVESMYGVDHNTYQDSLKPHIAKVAKDSASAKAEDIPANLDTKPYDNMGHPEQLHGQGDRPAQDAGQPGAGESKDTIEDKDVSPINARTIGAAALTLGAAGYGAYQAGPGHRTEGTFKGLFGGMTMFGHQAIFAGALSRDFNPILEKAAWGMEKAGRTPEQINLATGYHRAVGGKWLHEIDDSAMQVKPHNDPIWKKAEINPVPLDQVMHHTEFARNYPQLMKSVKVRVQQGKSGAHYDPSTGNITISDPAELERLAIHYKEPGLRPRSIIAHELMHVVQHLEGLPRGDSVGVHVLQLNEEAENLINHGDYLEKLLREELQSNNPDQVKVKNYRESIDRIDKQLATQYSVKAIKEEARRRYNASAGESQAVNVQDRLNYDKATRRDLAPHTSAKVAFPDQRVEYNREQSPHLQAHELHPWERPEPDADTLYALGYTPESYRKMMQEEKARWEDFQPKKGLYPVYKESPHIKPLRDAVQDAHNNLARLFKSKDGIERISIADEKFIDAANARIKEANKKLWEAVRKDEEAQGVYKDRLGRQIANPYPEKLKLVSKDSDIQAHEMPISDHLQKTGEMDEEGKLSGMVLPEDKLPNEHEVLAKAAQNDQGAISKLYKQYMPRLIRNARGLMRTAGPRLGMDAEDLAMYVFHKAIMHLRTGSFKGDSSFYTWMHTILHNTGLNEISRAGRQVPTESIHGATHDAFGSPVSDIKPAVRNIDSGESTPEENMIAQQASNMVQHAISKLPQDIREAIKAYEFDGKSYEEIAREQGVPVGTVRSRLNRGRDMIEQSIKRGHGANFRKQGGFATVDQMKRAVLLGAGAFAGYTLGGQDHHWKDAFYGALAGIGAGAITFRGITRVVHDVKSADTLPRASSTLDKLEGSLGKLQRHTDTIQAQMKALQGVDSLNIAHSIEGDTSIKLTPEQQKVKETAQTLYTHIRDMAKVAGMSMQELENYTTHLFKPTEANKAIIDAFNKQQSTPLSKNSPFTKTRKLRMSLADVIAKGMELKHDNFADTFAEYYKSMLGAIHTKVAIDTLRVATDLENRPLITKTSMAPYGYQVINHPALRGLSIHPAIAAEMSHMFDVYTPTHLGFAYQFVNSALKRIAFMGSLFHGQTLADVQTGMSLNPYNNIKTTLQALTGNTEFQKAIKNPQPGDMVDKILETGQKVPSNSAGFTEDLGKSMSPGFKFLEDEMNKLFPGLGNLPRAAAAIDHAYQWIIFNRLGGGLMGQATHIMFGKLKANWIKEITKDPSKVMPSDEDLMRRAASMSSVSFGSLNWRRMANEVQNKYMRSFLMSTFSPAGRRVIQSIMLAPEWLTSTTMHWTKALFGKGEGSPIHPLNAVDLHRSWLMKSLIYSTLFGNALNWMFSGHSMMENKDKFMIDLGDGQKTPWMKELSDFPRLVMDPAQEILNKLSPTVRLIGQQLTGKQYLSAKGYSPSLTTPGQRVQNALETMSPFSMSQNNTGGWKADVASMLGHPIYGMTPTTKRDAMMKRKQELLKEKMSKLSGGQ